MNNGGMGGGGGNPNFGRSRGVCFDWQKGSCERGENCRFTHSNEAEGADGQGPYATYGGRRGFGNVRPGDWNCQSCQVNNFASRINCFKCNAPKPEGGAGMDQNMGGGGGFNGGGFNGGGSEGEEEEEEDSAMFVLVIGTALPAKSIISPVA